jgi:pyrroline-5-carboxylate reductase
MTNLGFIGIGKIASAVIKGFCTGECSDLTLRLSPRNCDKSVSLAKKYPNVFRMDSNQAVVDGSDILFLALRPPQAPEILESLVFKENQIIVSFIPLINYSDLAKMVAPAHRISRAIPLPPVVNHNCPIPIFKPNESVVNLLGRIGQVLPVHDENQLHTLWTLTCLITPYYDLLQELSNWSTGHGVDRTTANQYIANLFQALSYTAQIADPIEFDELAKHAATPGGLNEQSGKEITAAGSHLAYREAAERILQRFPRS